MKRIFTLAILALSFGAVAQNTYHTTAGGCATVTPQHELEKIYDFVQHNSAAYRRGTAGQVDYIPLSIHIVGNDAGSGYYSLYSLFPVICQLNDRFASANFHFYIQWPLQYINSTDYYIQDYFSGEMMMQQYNDPNSVNVYFVQDPAGNCGYYTYGADAVSIAKSCASTGSTTLAHELGHYFSLPHTFSGWEYGTPSNPERVTRTGPGANCNSAGDGFCDTYADYLSSRWNCPGPVNKQDANGDYYHLDSSMYMSYSSDICQSRFSNQQMAAMQYNLHSGRGSFAGAATPPALPLDTVRMIYPVDTVYTNLKKAVWNKIPGADYYYVRIVLQAAPSAVLESAFVADTSMNIAGTSMVDNGHYQIVITPVNAHNTCMEYVTRQPFIYSSRTGQVAIASVPGNNQGILAYPNPLNAGQQLSIEFNGLGTGAYTINIASVNGQVIHEEQLMHHGGNARYQVSLNRVAAGLYFIRCKGAGGQFTQKLIIQQ